MYSTRPNFLNFEVDHITMLASPEMYNVYYAVFRIVFGVTVDDIVYEKRKEWKKGEGERSLTYAVNVGNARSQNAVINRTMIAMVQPSEPPSMPSHVRRMLEEHRAASHWQHVALRTPDLISFHQHAESLGINFITPILKDDDDDLIQVFSGEWFSPQAPASALFFEFVQRDVTAELLKKIEDRNRESFFRDKTFLGLYGTKETEYQSNKVKPFIDEALFDRLYAIIGKKNQWEITEADLEKCEKTMREFAKN